MQIPALILVPTDFSDLSRKALDLALALARDLKSRVHVVHVCPLLYYALADEAAVQDPAFEKKLKERLAEKLDELRSELHAQGHRVETSLADGNPGQRIPELASELGAGLIVLGTHGRSGVQHLMLGSVAERVVRTAGVPVLTVR